MKRYAPALAAIVVMIVIHCTSAPPVHGEVVDLTRLSGTMVYAEVFNMMVSPEDYVGKTVRMQGKFAVYQDVTKDGEPIPDKLFFTCEIEDAAACCAQGIEFVLSGSRSYPGDYPEPGSEITVAGNFECYEDGEMTFIRLIDARFEPN